MNTNELRKHMRSNHTHTGSFKKSVWTTRGGVDMNTHTMLIHYNFQIDTELRFWRFHAM